MLRSALSSTPAMQHNRNTTSLDGSRISQCPAANGASSLYMISMVVLAGS